MNKPSFLFCNINKLKFKKKTNTCNTLQRNTRKRKFAKTYTLRYFNYLSK